MLLAQYYPFKYEIVPFYILLSEWEQQRPEEEIQHLSGGLFLRYLLVLFIQQSLTPNSCLLFSFFDSLI